MTNDRKDSLAGRAAGAPHNWRLITFLVALSCLCMGITIGVLLRAAADARDEDHRLTVSHSQPTPDSLSAAFARVAEQVEPAVVHIKVYESASFSREGTGSGVIVNAAGYILTNHHVVERAVRIRVKLYSGAEYDARVLGKDEETDLAVIKIDPPAPLPVARMGDSDRLRVGDWVLAIGSPFGYAQTVTAGIISARDREDGTGATPFQRFLQTDAAINPGNSGGPLVNINGEVVGINTQIATRTGVNEGIGFALPSLMAVEIYNQLVAHGRVRRGFLGVNIAELTPEVARLNKVAEGVQVSQLTDDDGPAARAGLRRGDVITAVNGNKVRSGRELVRLIAALPVGSTAQVDFVRAGEPRSVSVRLDERRSDDEVEIREMPFDPRDPRRRGNAPERSPGKSGLGLSVRTLTGDEARQRGIEGARGALVIDIEPRSAADDKLLEIGDVIIEVNSRPVLNQEDFNRLVRGLRSGDEVILKVLRRDENQLPRSFLVVLTMP